MHNSFRGFVHSHYPALVVATIGILCVASVVLADIVSGSFTTNSSTNVTITNLVLSKPSDIAQGDFMLANVTLKGGSAESITAPAGWTQIQRTDNAINVSVVSYWKIASASEPASYTWTITPQTRAVGGITRYTGVDPTNPIDVASSNIGHGTTASALSITTGSSNEEIITLFAMDSGLTNTGHFSTPAGMTEKYDTSNTPMGPSTAEDDVMQVASGASGSKSATISGIVQRNWVAQAIALRRVTPGIAFDNSTLNTANFDVSSSIFSHTVIGNTNGFLVVAVEFNPNSSYAITGITYDGAALIDTGWHPSASLTGAISVWYLFAPSAGTHNVVITATTPTIRHAIVASYTGVRQSGFPDASGTGNPDIITTATTHMAESVTTVADNSWVIMPFTKNGGSTPTGDFGTVLRQIAEPFGGNINFADSNGPVHPAGAYAIGATTPDANKWASVFFSIAPTN